MKTLLIGLLSLVSTLVWTVEREPNNLAPKQTVGFCDLRIQGSLSSDTDLDLYKAWLGFPYPFLTQWLGSLRVIGEPDKFMEVEVWETTWWWGREKIAHEQGWGQVDLVFLHVHDPFHPYAQEIRIKGEKQRYQVYGPSYWY